MNLIPQKNQSNASLHSLIEVIDISVVLIVTLDPCLVGKFEENT